jgi:ParB-like chromosome segregation protein Spo0J
MCSVKRQVSGNIMTVEKPMDWPADKVVRRAVADLVPYAKNSRTHDELQIQQIADSIKEWGWTTPVLVDEEGMLIAGHGRIMAAQLLGIEEVPTMVAVGWTDAQKRAYVIADNKLALNAGWDEELLKLELSDLMDEGFSLSLTGFEMEELSALANEEIELPQDTETMTRPNGGERKLLKLSFGKRSVALTEEEFDLLTAALEAHVEKYGMTSGFVGKSLCVQS